MFWRPSLICRALMGAAGVAAAIVFSLPGGAVLSELFWQATQMRLPGIWSACFSLGHALGRLVVVSPSTVFAARAGPSPRWGMRLRTTRFRRARCQPALTWLPSSPRAAVGPWLVCRQSGNRPQSTRRRGDAVQSAVAAWFPPFYVTLLHARLVAVIMSVLLALLARDNERVAWQDRMATTVSGWRCMWCSTISCRRLRLPVASAFEDEEETRRAALHRVGNQGRHDEQLVQLFQLGLKELPDLSEIRLQRSLVTDNDC